MYSKTAADHFHHPRHVGVLAGANAVGQHGKPGQGPYMVLYLRIQENRIEESSFQTYGCPAAIACGSWVSEWVLGRTVEEAERISTGLVNDGLGGLPLGKEHCPPLAAGAVREAIANFRAKVQSD